MFAQNLFIVFLFVLILLTAIDPTLSLAAGKKKSKADLEVEKALEPISADLGPLSQKSLSHGLFSPKEVSQTSNIKLQLLDLMTQYPTSPTLTKSVFQAGQLFRGREMYDDAYDMFNFIQANFAKSPYASMARIEIQRMKQKVGEAYFAEPPTAQAK
jgi:hypothetical protein